MKKRNPGEFKEKQKDLPKVQNEKKGKVRKDEKIITSEIKRI